MTWQNRDEEKKVKIEIQPHDEEMADVVQQLIRNAHRYCCYCLGTRRLATGWKKKHRFSLSPHPNGKEVDKIAERKSVTITTTTMLTMNAVRSWNKNAKNTFCSKNAFVTRVTHTHTHSLHSTEMCWTKENERITHQHASSYVCVSIYKGGTFFRCRSHAAAHRAIAMKPNGNE